MDKASLLALVAQQNLDLVSAINQLADASPDPLQGALDEANSKIASLQSQIDKALVDEAVVAEDLKPSA